MLKIGITGASGFLGVSLIQYLGRQARCQIRALDRILRPEILAEASYVAWQTGDLASEEDCARFVDGLDVIIHLAHTNTPLTSNHHLPSDASLNLIPTLTLLEAIRKAQGRPHFIYPSSGGAVYGRPAEHRPFRESDGCQPVTSYGIQKLAAEHYIRLAAESGWLSGTCLRIGNPYGVLLPPERKQGLIGVIFSQLVHHQPVTIFGDANNIRDYIHLEDVCSMFHTLLDRSGQFEIFNVGSGVGHSVKAILDLLASLLGRKIEVRVEPANEDADKLVPWVVLDISKSAQCLRWQPTVTLEEGLARLCAECRERIMAV